jgi:hypothetical protein
MAFVSDSSSFASLGDTICFGSLEFPIAPRAGPWAPPILRPFQAFHSGSLDFVADHLHTLGLHEEATPVMSLEGDTPSTEPLADLDTEALAHHIELMHGANPSASDTNLLLFSLRHVSSTISTEGPRCPHRVHCVVGSRLAPHTPRAFTLGSSGGPYHYPRLRPSSWARLGMVLPHSTIFSPPTTSFE